MNLVDLGTYKEWQAICKKYKKPEKPPAKKLGDLTLRTKTKANVTSL